MHLPPFAPRNGPVLLTARALVNVQIPGGTVTAPGAFPALTADPAVYRWPKSSFCTGILLLHLSGLAADAAALSVRWTDETAYDVINDGQGGAFDMPLVAMQSTQLGKYFPMQRPVIGGDEWLFRIFNRSAAPIFLAGIFFTFQDPKEVAA